MSPAVVGKRSRQPVRLASGRGPRARSRKTCMTVSKTSRALRAPFRRLFDPLARQERAGPSQDLTLHELGGSPVVIVGKEAMASSSRYATVFSFLPAAPLSFASSYSHWLDFLALCR